MPQPSKVRTFDIEGQAVRSVEPDGRRVWLCECPWLSQTIFAVRHTVNPADEGGRVRPYLIYECRPDNGQCLGLLELALKATSALFNRES
jgi:hypothetical protein